MKAIQVENLLDYHSISSLVLSEDCHYAAFCITDSLKNKEGYSSSVWTINLADGTVLKRAEDTSRTVFFLDNTHIVYTALRRVSDKASVQNNTLLTVFQAYDIKSQQESELFRVPLNNAQAWPLTDGRFLLKSYMDNNRPDFEHMDESTVQNAKEQYRLNKDYIVCQELPFAYDGSYYISGKRNRLFIFDTANGTIEPVTEPYFNTDLVCVIPGGKDIVFSGSSFTKLSPRCQGIYTYNVKSKLLAEIIPSGKYQVMGLSGSSLQNIMVSAEPWDGMGPFPNHNIYKLDIDKKELLLCLKHDSEDFGLKTCTDTRLGPGNTFCATDHDLWYIVTRNNSSLLVKYNKDYGFCAVTKEDDCIDYFAYRDNLILCIACCGKSLQEIYKVDAASGELLCLTHINDYITDNFYISAPQPLSFINKDNVRIDGFVIPPVDYDPAKTYPGILEIHGGPRAAYTKSFNHEMQVLSSRGYFVFYCNPRGSCGRGEAFAESRGIRGTIDYSDIMEFCDHVLKLYPSIDSNRLGVAGGSYGGFMVNWIIGHTHRFAAAVSMRSLSDFIADYGAADHSMWGDKGILQGDPWNDTLKLWDESPLKYAMSVTTPTLFLQSLQDMRCPLVHAQQMYSALMWRGIDTRMCIFKDECHELSRSGKPRHRIRRLEEIVSWMDLYLKA